MKTKKYHLMIAIFVSISLTSCREDGSSLLDNLAGDNYEATSETMIKLYHVIDGNLTVKETGVAQASWMENPVKHNEIWDFYKAFTLSEDLAWIDEFEVYDGEGSEYGYVVNLDDDLKKWRLGLAIDGAYSSELNEDSELAHTIIHEQFHILSLNNTQLNPNTESCYYDNQEGCAFDGSYLDDFVETFWEDILEEHEKINQNNSNKLYRFYKKYEDQFVNDYAATNPEEDIAESFTYFVKIEEGATGNLIKDQKIAHFYKYPELVTLRDKIRLSGIELGSAILGKKSRKHRNCKHQRVNKKG